MLSTVLSWLLLARISRKYLRPLKDLSERKQLKERSIF